MKLLPVTLTLFDKVTNNTYKGTLLLKNLNGLENESQNASAIPEEEGEDYDGKGAGLFIILVVSVYALSIVLFIASFITKKANVGEAFEENTVNAYLHKVGDLKEKTARDHFKKLKMSITSKMEMDSENQKRGRKGSKGAKDMQSISRASSRVSLADVVAKAAGRPSGSGAEAIPSTGLLPKEDDATQPLLSGTQDTPTPPAHDLLHPGFESGRCSPSLRRATSARMLSVIREVPDNEGGDLQQQQVGRTVSYHDVSVHGRDNRLGIPQSLSAPDATPVKKVVSSDDIISPSKARGPQDPRPPSAFTLVPQTGDDEGRGFTPVQQHPAGDNVEQEKDMVKRAGEGRDAVDRAQGPHKMLPEEQKAVTSLERPRPRHSARPVAGQREDVWQHMPQQPLPPPPERRASRKPPNLRVQIPQPSGPSEIWVLRNGRSELRDRPLTQEARARSPTSGREYIMVMRDGTRKPRSPRTLQQYEASGGSGRRERSPRGKSPRERSPRERSPRERSPREKSPREKSPKDWSPRDWSTRDRSPRSGRDPGRDNSMFPHDARSLPLPFRTPSPRSPPRSPGDHMPPQTRVSPLRPHPDAPTGPWRGAEKGTTLKVTLDRSPTGTPERDPYYGGANSAYEQSPQHRAPPGGRDADRTSSAHDESSSRLQIPHPHFPVTFNSPGLPRRTEEKDVVQISKV